jgi:hypothetical protein
MLLGNGRSADDEGRIDLPSQVVIATRAKSPFRLALNIKQGQKSLSSNGAAEVKR